MVDRAWDNDELGVRNVFRRELGVLGRRRLRVAPTVI
jgi:hypothetical protein